MAAPVRRDARRYRRRILSIGAVLFGLLFVVGAPIFVDRVEADLEERVPEELSDAGFDGIAAAFDGQDGMLSCIAPLADPEAARQAAYDVWGVRSIELDRSCRVNTDAVPAADTVPDEPTTTPPSADDAVGDADDTADDGDTVEPPATTVATTEPAFATVADAVAGSPQLSLFALLLQEADLIAELSDPAADPVTLFAPTDDAFESLPADVLAELRSDPEALATVLHHHLTDGALMTADLESGPLEMRDGATVDVDADVPSIGGFAVSVNDIVSSTGVVHIIDGVLVPDGMDLAPTQPAASVNAGLDAGTIELAGVVSTEAVRATLVAATEGSIVVDMLTVDSETGLDAGAAASLANLIDTMQAYLLAGDAGFDGEDLYLAGTCLTEDAQAAALIDAAAEGVVAVLTLPPNATEEDAVDLELELNEFVADNPILFEPGSSSITESSQPTVDQVALLAQQYRGVRITVQGHTDSDGDPQRNLDLSRARALAVQEALIERGIPADRLRFEGFGSERPVLIDGVEDKAASRRVEFDVEART